MFRIHIFESWCVFAIFSYLLYQFSRVVETSISFAFAFTLGLLHSLEPSHAKAVLASFFLNRKRTVREAIFFAIVVTLAHTMSIYLLAIGGYVFGPFLKKMLIHRDMLEAWSEMIGAILMIVIGVWMFWNEQKVGFHKKEDHDHDHSHGHFFHHHHYSHEHPAPSSWRQIFVLGFCSGAIPCMSGLAVLLKAWTTASPYRGLALVAVFSLGLGVVVLVMCLAMQQMARTMDLYWKKSSKWTRFLPTLSSIVIFLMGIGVLINSLI